MLNCTGGSIDDSNFSKPMPIIGVYIAAASLLCAIGMAIDAANGIRSKQYWIPNGWFSVNAASVTVVGVAIKLSVDLNSPMPSKVDQLSKLTTSAFICTVLVNFLPSLGVLENSELVANTIALAILVITSIVNLCIQLNTGVILSFKAAHIAMIVFMSYDLLNGICGGALLQTWKNYLQLRYEQKHQQDKRIGRLISLSESGKKPQELREYLTIISMMAQSGCPHFVMARSIFATTLVFYGGLGPVLTIFIILFATIIHKDNFIHPNTCSGESNYGWSSLGILITQTIAIVVGLVAPILRGFYFVNINNTNTPFHENKKKEPREEEEGQKEEEEADFWMWHLDGAKVRPILYSTKGKRCAYVLYYMKCAIYTYGMIYTCGINKGTNLAFLERGLGKGKGNFTQEPMGLAAYLLHSPVEKRNNKWMEELCSRVTQAYIDKGKRGTPKNLIGFLKEHVSCDFDGVASFYNDEIQIPPLASSSKSPPNCWGLAVVTLTSVATALPNIDPSSKERLMRSVNEGLKYVEMVEDLMNGRDDFITTRVAATTVRLRLHRNCSWLFGINLREIAPQSATPREALLSLATSAEKRFSKFTSCRGKEAYTKTWHGVAALSMYRICKTMLQQEDRQNESSSSDEIFKRLSITIADILGACFTNLRPYIVSTCKRCSIEKRRENVLGMLQLFGETEEIMEILAEEGRKIPDIPSDKRGFMDEWRSYLKRPKSEHHPPLPQLELHIDG